MKNIKKPSMQLDHYKLQLEPQVHTSKHCKLFIPHLFQSEEGGDEEREKFHSNGLIV